MKHVLLDFDISHNLWLSYNFFILLSYHSALLSKIFLNSTMYIIYDIFV